MTGKSEFEIGRAQGKSGFGGNLYDTEAYRQGLLVGATQRQNDILREQGRKEDARREGEQREREQQSRDDQDEIDREEWEQQRREDAARDHDLEKQRARSLLDSLTQMIDKTGKLRPLQRDAMYFATQAALNFKSKHSGLESMLRQAGEAAAKLFRDEPTAHESIVSLAHALQAFRKKLASHNLALPFNAAYARDRVPSEPLLGPQFHDDGTPPAWLSKEASWLNVGKGQKIEGHVHWLSSPSLLVASLQGDVSELRKLVALASAAGLWQVPPHFLAYASSQDPASSNKLITPVEMVDLVCAHRDFLVNVERSKDDAELIREWIIVQNEKVAAFLSRIENGRDAITNWLDGDNLSWPKFSKDLSDAQSNTLERLPFVRDFREAARLINKRRSTLRCLVDTPVANPDQIDAKAREDVLTGIRDRADRSRPARDVLEACTNNSRDGSGTWSLDKVDRKSAQLVCSLMGPFHFISVREALIGAVVGVVVGLHILGWGGPWPGFLMILGSICLGLYGFGFLPTEHMDEEISQSYTSQARRAYRACPQLTADEKYKLLHAILEGAKTQREEMQEKLLRN